MPSQWRGSSAGAQEGVFAKVHRRRRRRRRRSPARSRRPRPLPAGAQGRSLKNNGGAIYAPNLWVAITKGEMSIFERVVEVRARPWWECHWERQRGPNLASCNVASHNHAPPTC